MHRHASTTVDLAQYCNCCQLAHATASTASDILKMVIKAHGSKRTEPHCPHLKRQDLQSRRRQICKRKTSTGGGAVAQCKCVCTVMFAMVERP